MRIQPSQLNPFSLFKRWDFSEPQQLNWSNKISGPPGGHRLALFQRLPSCPLASPERSQIPSSIRSRMAGTAADLDREFKPPAWSIFGEYAN